MKGFSLIEVLVVASIITIVLGFATIQFSKWVKKYSIESDVKDIYAFLQRIRQKAFSEKMDFVISVNNKSICYSCNSSDTGCINRYGEANIECLDLSNSFNSVSINVYRRGTFSNGTIRYASVNEAKYDCVIVSLLRARLGKCNGS